MFANMKLGQKIAFGFASLIVITMILGGVVVWNMSGVCGSTKILAEEYVPEVQIATGLERASRMVMYANRGYGFTEDETYLADGRSSMTEVKRFLEEASALAGSAAHLVKLQGEIDDVKAGLNQYEALVEETVQTFAELSKNRTTLDASAKQYMDNCESFLASQNTSMQGEYQSGAAALKERHQKIIWITDIIDNGNAVRLVAWRSQAERNPQIIRDALPAFDTIDQHIAQIRTITRKDVNIQELDRIQSAASAYRQAMLDLLDNWQRIQDLGGERETAAQQVLAGAQETADAGMNNTTTIATDANSALSASSAMMLIGLVIAIALGTGLAYFITRSITGPIRRVIENLTSGAGQVAAAANQVSASSQSMAEGASEQASSLEEVSSSLEEMTSMTRQNAENAKQANATSAEAQSAAIKGSDAMHRMSDAIDKIKASSDETAKIIKTIDEIAFQTNLLALNAAVEAARAGEAGMGFAVVAEEVRNLAQRSAEAAKNTAALIEESQSNADNGVHVSREVSDILTEISTASTRVSHLISEVSTANEEQAEGINQVNSAISQMDQATQSAAANTEESASASEELSSQAMELSSLVDVLVGIVGSSNGSGGARQAITGTRPAQRRAATATATPRVLTAARASSSGPKTRPDDIIPLDDEFENF